MDLMSMLREKGISHESKSGSRKDGNVSQLEYKRAIDGK